MQQVTAFIVDDEPQGRSFLRSLLAEQFPHINIAGEASAVKEAVERIGIMKPDIVFLDIQMKGETGFDLLQQFPHLPFSLIFITAFDQYAIKAFRFNAIDYLLKPVIKEELVEAVNKVIGREKGSHSSYKQQVDLLYQNMKEPHKSIDKMAVSTLDGFIIISLRDVIYCLAKDNYTEFYLNGNKRILSSHTLKQYDTLLSGQSFFRAHRSYLINLDHVVKYHRGEGGKVVMSNGDEIELSRTHKEEFLHLLNIR